MSSQTEQTKHVTSPTSASASASIDKSASAPKGISTPHESAALHVAGEATYIDDIPELAGTLYAALGLSERAHADISNIDLSEVEAFPGVVAVIQAADIPGDNQCGPIIKDDPILADGTVQYVGQPIFIVVADSIDIARKASRKANIDYQDLTANITTADARAADEKVIPPMHLSRGEAAQALENAPHRLSASFSVGGQDHFYLEGQISYALPTEGGGIYLHCSTQHPTEMQHLVSHALNIPDNQVTVEIRRMGGGFGGKESQSALFACAASIAAHKLNRPVKLRLDRDDDMMITGKRHGFDYHYEVGFDDCGKLLAFKLDMTLQAGFSADLSGPVAARAITHSDNAYYLEHTDIAAYCARTNTQSNTAFRGFGGPQGIIAIEHAIDSVARQLGREPADIRAANFYGTPDSDPTIRTTPYGQVIVDTVMPGLFDDILKSSDYAARRAAIREFNQSSPVLKRGIAATPVKFGISFNVPHFNQAGALVHIYTDGSVLVNHGGTEMGQGLHSKIERVVADELGIHIKHVRSTATNTSKVPNTSATAASSGTDLNGKAAQDAARQIRQKITTFLAERDGVAADSIHFADDTVTSGEATYAFPDVIRQAYEARVQLWSDGFYSTPKIHWDASTLTGSPFYYFAYGAAVSEVIIDTLTGEMKLLQADILHDVGNSINPAIDRGQIEGAYIQGVGWLTSEELCWNEQGKLTTHAPSTYKIPAVNDYPTKFHVELFNNQNVEDSIRRSKAVGEPPLVLGMSAFFAIRDAIGNAGNDAADKTEGLVRQPELNAPATPENILRAVWEFT